MVKMEANNSYPIQIGKGIKASIASSLVTLIILGLIVFIGIIYFVFSKNIMPDSVPLAIIGAIVVMVIPIMSLVIFFTIIVIIYSWLSMKFTSYSLEAKTIIFKTGILARSEKNLPYSKIQHVVIYEGFWQRVFNIASVSIETAGEGGFIQQNPQQIQLRIGPFIPNLLKEDAVKLKNEILIKALKTKGSGI